MTISSSGKAKGQPSYRIVAETLREQIRRREFGDSGRLPTEAELRQIFSVSRHTVREALQQLESDGLIYRVQGRGTFATAPEDGERPYQRRIGSLEEIVVWPDTSIEVLKPFALEVNPPVASRLKLPYIEVYRATLRRWYEGAPFVVTEHYVSPELGVKLVEAGVPTGGGDGTVIGQAERFLEHKVAGARQEITAMAAPAREAELIGCEPDAPILLIERLYYDATGRFVEMTASHFNPRRYSYRMDLRRRS